MDNGHGDSLCHAVFIQELHGDHHVAFRFDFLAVCVEANFEQGVHFDVFIFQCFFQLCFPLCIMLGAALGSDHFGGQFCIVRNGCILAVSSCHDISFGLIGLGDGRFLCCFISADQSPCRIITLIRMLMAFLLCLIR